MIKKEKLAKFFSDLRLILKERKGSVIESIQAEWHWRLQRAKAWEEWGKFERVHSESEDDADMTDAVIAQERLTLLESRRLISLARKYNVPLPELADSEIYYQVEWVINKDRPRCLTEKGFSTVLLKIEEAKKQRREKLGYWLGLVIGLIGAITGLVAVIGRLNLS